MAATVDKEENENSIVTQTDPSEFTFSRCTQTEDCYYMFETPKPWLPEKSTVFELNRISSRDMFRFYTGLHSIEVLMKTFSFVSPHVIRRSL